MPFFRRYHFPRTKFFLYSVVTLTLTKKANQAADMKAIFEKDKTKPENVYTFIRWAFTHYCHLLPWLLYHIYKNLSLSQRRCDLFQISTAIQLGLASGVKGGGQEIGRLLKY